LTGDFLSADDRNILNNGSETIETLKSEIEKVNTKLANVDKFLSTITDSRSIETLRDEINDFQIKLETIQNYVEMNKELKQLKDLGDSLTPKQAKEKEELVNEILVAQVEFGKIAQFINTNFSGDLKIFEEKLKKDIEIFDNLVAKEELTESKRLMEEKIEYINVKTKELKSSLNPSLESFKEFLESKGLSTIHAQDIYDYHTNPKTALTLKNGQFKIRKTHPKRDAFLKKVVVPTLITAGAAAAVAFGIAMSGLVGGSVVLGVIPVTSSQTITAVATSILAGATALVATPTIILSKNALTRKYYKLAYKDGKTNLKDYVNGTDLENLPMTKLIEKIENTKHKIIEANHGKAITKPFRFIKKHVLNTINRNRIHHLEACTKSLVQTYSSIYHNESIDPAEKVEKLNPIFELLKRVDGFISKDVQESKAYAMLTCKDKEQHTHKSMIENIDIFANLTTFVDKITQAQTEKEQKSKIKEAKHQTKNIKQKTAEAGRILNGERLITKMLGHSAYAPFTPSASTEFAVVGTSVYDDGKKVRLNLEGGKSIELFASEIGKTEDISKIKLGKNKTVITYTDNSTTEILKAKKIIPEIETAKRMVLYGLTTNEDFVNEVKNRGFDNKTIKALASKLEKSVADPTSNQNISRSSKIGQCYLTCLEMLKEATLDDEKNYAI
jgi:hypothetical protein